MPHDNAAPWEVCFVRTYGSAECRLCGAPNETGTYYYPCRPHTVMPLWCAHVMRITQEPPVAAAPSSLSHHEGEIPWGG